MGDEIAALHERLEREARAGGYWLNPDRESTLALAESLLVNERRYGYRACPCRLAGGQKENDLDIICPCDYRDADLEEHGACYCALYVSRRALDEGRAFSSIPDRRGADKKERAALTPTNQEPFALSAPVWRCRVCGYLCARDHAPETCPICKAAQERFERFI